MHDEEVKKQVRTALHDDPKIGSLLVADEGGAQAFASAKSTLERSYTTSTVLHFQLEPVNALAFEKDGVWEIHTGNQWQSLILPTLIKALGVTQDKVVMRTYLLGGGFGRRLNGDYSVPAALASKALGKPVKLLLTRYTPLRMRDVPELDVEFIDSTEVPVGLGEPGTTAVGPAIGNAIFAAVGARLRHIPIRPEAVLQEMKAGKAA